MSKVYERIALIGLGLIASSIFGRQKETMFQFTLQDSRDQRKRVIQQEKLGFVMKFLIL